MNFRVLLNRGPTSTQLISASTDFFATPSTLLEPKYHISLHNFRKCRWKNSKLSVLPENRHTDYGEDFTWKLPQRESILRMLILILWLFFWNSKPISGFGQIWVKKGEFSTSPGSWYTKCLEDMIVRIQRNVWK